MGDHGNARCAVRPDSASATRSHSPEGKPGEAAEEKAAGRSAAGAPKRPVPGGAGARERRSGLGVGPPARQSISPSVSPSSRLPLPGRRPLSLAACRLRLSSGARASSSPELSQSLRFSEAPQDPAERGGHAGACAERKVGWAGPRPAR